MSASLLTIPLELLHQIVGLLPLDSTHHLGATCRHLHKLIHQDDRLWKFKVKTRLRLRLQAGDSTACQDGDDDLCDIEGLLCDPTLQGHKELFLLFSPEFRKAIRAKQSQAINVNLDKLLRTFLPKFLLPPSSIIDPNFVPKIALFGPGIESPHTKHLVHKIVNAHTNIFDAEGFVPGLPGGFGSGVRIDFRKSFKFDLMCLYTNSSKVREYQKGVTRLLAGNNRLLINDVTSDADVLLHDNVLKLLPTLDALAFAVDGSDLEYTESEQAMEYLRSELTIMRDALKEDSAFRHIPILVLLCFNQGSDHVPSTLSLSTLAEGLGLSSETSRSWAIFEVQIANMEGMAKAVDWVVYHTHKRRNLLKYHQAAQSSAGTLF